ncbi:TrkH family potassium uptake protein [Thermodesulfobacteriota bacterium]
MFDQLQGAGVEFAMKRSGLKGPPLHISKSLVQSPNRIVIFGFAFLILIGTILLMLPASSKNLPLGFVDALFTSTSAVCVTGLTVVETGGAFSQFGQFIILVLIQAGGLGIMTLSTLFLLLARRRPSLTGQIIIQDTYTHSRERSITEILKDVVLFTLVIEAAGAAVLFFCFFSEFGTINAFILAVFHSVSAFCNAGFSLFSDSFVGYRENWLLNTAIGFLIVSGGIGFLVISELKQKFSFRRPVWSRLSLHSKIVLSATLILLISGMVLILILEWGNTLAPLSLHGRFLSAFFQSVTARTAGFNTLPIGHMANETLFILILFMFIGASPGSCGGGVKTTTLATLMVMGMSRFRGQERPQLFNRSISESSVRKAISVVMLSTAVVCAGMIALQMTELGSVSHLQSRGKFLELLFEVVSAFGTVGLSTGVTGGLSVSGKIIVTLTMFVGRLGPLVIGVAVSRQAISRYHYAEEGIMVG